MAQDAFGKEKSDNSYTISLRGVLAAIVITLLVVVALQNFESVQIQLLFWGVKLPLWAIIAGSAFLGALLDGSVRNLYRYLRGKPPVDDD